MTLKRSVKKLRNLWRPKYCKNQQNFYNLKYFLKRGDHKSEYGRFLRKKKNSLQSKYAHAKVIYSLRDFRTRRRELLVHTKSQ